MDMQLMLVLLLMHHLPSCHLAVGLSGFNWVSGRWSMIQERRLVQRVKSAVHMKQGRSVDGKDSFLLLSPFVGWRWRARRTGRGDERRREWQTWSDLTLLHLLLGIAFRFSFEPRAWGFVNHNQNHKSHTFTASTYLTTYRFTSVMTLSSRSDLYIFTNSTISRC